MPIATVCLTRRIRSRPTTWVAVIPTPTIRMPEDASNTTAARRTAGCARARATSTPSAITRKAICLFSRPPRGHGRRATVTSAPSWQAPFPTRSISTRPTLWDTLASHGVSGRYYFSDIPFLGLWGDKYRSITRNIAQFYLDCALGRLPAVSFVDPRFIGAEFGLADNDHPHADVRNGQAFLNGIYEAVISSPNWPGTVLVINYDEWGGFFDHVPPPFAPIPTADLVAGNNDGLLGFRVPCLVIAPWAQRGAVAHDQYDHTSILKMIEDRWGLPPLTVRAAGARSLADVLDLNHPVLDAPRFAVPGESYEHLCPLPDVLTLDTV